MRTRSFSLSILLWAGSASAAAAQIISIRTVPISQAHQFDLFPSLRLAMGGVGVALDDSLLDPFSNPAKGFRLGTTTFFGSPGLYGVSNRAGAGRTLPLGALGRSGNWFGGVSVAAQQVDLSDNAGFPFPLPVSCPVCDSRGVDLQSTDRTHGNTYAFAMLGREFREAGISIGGSLFWSGLHAVDGVDLLYAGSAQIKQYGDALDLRIGAVKQWDGDRSLSALVVHNRFATTHDVFYLDQFWEPGPQQFAQRARLEQNLDRTNTWGLHLEYQQPLRAPGWRIGWVATTNLASHPKIPNYEIQNIPRDPGNSEAFNFGIGVSRSHQLSTFGLDLIYEPIWSYTWADAAGPVETVSGDVIPAGGKTIENRFRFSNAVLRMGFGQDLELERSKAIGLQLGLMVHSIDYSLAQRDNVQRSARRLDESWVEWTPTWGISLRFPAWEIRYRGSATHGTGRPGVFPDNVIMAAEAPRAGNILVAPSGPLTLSSVRVMTHQVSVSFPFR
jgi:hypothetical protein